MAQLSENQKAIYVGTGGVRCPHCHSVNLSTDPFETDDNYAVRDVKCDDCGEAWQDIYTLTGIEEQ